MGEYLHNVGEIEADKSSVSMGTAGYGDDHWSIGQSYGQNPVYSPAIYK